MADLKVNVAGVEFANPLIAASGTFGFGREYNEFYPLSVLGGISCKGITIKERPGNPPPRVTETPGGMLNAVGLQNPGVALDLVQSEKGCPGFANPGIKPHGFPLTLGHCPAKVVRGAECCRVATGGAAANFSL